MKIIDHYERCLEQHGDTHKGVDWPKAEDAATRYQIMLDVIPKEASSVELLDFGCGTAHLYEYIIKNNYKNSNYIGMDLSKKFISVCKQKHPGLRFICGDVLDDPSIVPANDYTVINGVFTEKCGLNNGRMFEYFQRIITLLCNKARKGIAFNLMSKNVDWEREDLFHVPLDELTRFLTKDISRYYVIRNDYGLYEYTVYVYKEPKQWQK